MAVLFGSKSTDSLNKMQYNNFSKKIVSASSFFVWHLSIFPPTDSATKLHSRRVYYQIMTWIGKPQGMDAMDWAETSKTTSRPRYVDNERRSRHSLEGHSLQLLPQFLKDTMLLLSKKWTTMHFCQWTLPSYKM